jgi:plastocyanin
MTQPILTFLVICGGFGNQAACRGPSCRATADGVERGRNTAPSFSDQSVLSTRCSFNFGRVHYVTFLLHRLGYARNLKGLITASVAAGALTVPVVFAFSATNTATVTVFDFGFNPVNIRVPVGQPVTWSYPSGASEHLIAADDGTFSGNVIMPGQAYTSPALSFARVYPYHCAIHSFMKGEVVAVGSPPHDANNDGKSDILWREAGGGAAVWLMNGANVLQAPEIGTVPTNWNIVGQRDFDGDGKYDLLWRDTNGDTAIWFMNGGQVKSSAGLGNISPNWTVVGTGEFDGDGYADILWQDNNGNIAIWLLQSGQVTSSTGLGAVPSSSL